MLKLPIFGFAASHMFITLKRKPWESCGPPCRWNYMKLGVVGYLQAVKADGETQGYKRGYADGYKDGAHAEIEEIYRQPIETMGLSTRAYNCLKAYHCELIGEVAQLPDETICRMRNLGVKSANEIAQKLQTLGITQTAWDAYLRTKV